MPYVVTSVGFSSAAVACPAAIPDRRGPALAPVGLSLPVGAVTGSFIAQLVAPNLTAMILLPAIIAAVGADLFAVRLRDRQPATLVPAVAPLLLAVGASTGAPQNVTALFLFGAAAGLIGAVCILPIRGVR